MAKDFRPRRRVSFVVFFILFLVSGWYYFKIRYGKELFTIDGLTNACQAVWENTATPQDIATLVVVGVFVLLCSFFVMSEWSSRHPSS